MKDPPNFGSEGTAVRPSNVDVDSQHLPEVQPASTAVPENTPPPPQTAAWTKVFTNDVEGFWFGTIHADGPLWYAGGKETIIEGTEQSSETVYHRLPKRFIQEIATVPGIGLTAAGSFELILERRDPKWKEVHWNPRSRTDKVKFPDVLDQVAIVNDEKMQHKLAWGPVGMFERMANGSWVKTSAKMVEHLNQFAHFGLSEKMACTPKVWRWFGDGQAWYLCQGGQNYIYDHGNSSQAASLDQECADNIGEVGVNTSGVALTCNGLVKEWRPNSTGWRQFAAPDELRGVALSQSCVLGVSETSVWRTCVPSIAP
jgi:hypothetical protein